MKNYVKVFICLVVAGSLFSCSDDDSGSNTNNPSSAVMFNGDGIEFVDVSLDAYPNSKTEAILTTMNNVSIIIYFKKDDDSYQGTADGMVNYDADGMVYNQEANYPDNTVRGYINSGEGKYRIMSGTIKIKLNENGKHQFVFDNVMAESEEEDEVVLDGETTITESN